MIAQVIGEGTPLILIHGFGVDHRILLPLENLFRGTALSSSHLGDASKQWQRIYLDLPWAQGATDTGARSPRELADQVLDEIQAIVGDQDFAILGISFGAMVARHVAFTLQDQCLGLATVVGAFEMDTNRRTLPDKSVAVFDQTILDKAEEFAEDFEFMAVVHTQEALDLFNTYVVPGLAGAHQEVLERLKGNYSDAYFPERQGAPLFTAPALHLLAQQDHVVGFEDALATRSHYPNGEFVVIENGGHHVHLEKPQEVEHEINNWLQKMRIFS